MSQHLDIVISDYVRSEKKLEEALKDFEGRFISRVLDASRGNRSEAARVLGIHRNTLMNKMNRMATRRR